MVRDDALRFANDGVWENVEGVVTAIRQGIERLRGLTQAVALRGNQFRQTVHSALSIAPT